MTEKKPDPKNQPAPLPTTRGQVEVAQAGLGALDQILRENIRLKAEVEQLRAEASRRTGAEDEMKLHIQRIQKDLDHYRRVATVLGTHMEQLHQTIERITMAMPPLDPPHQDLDESAARMAQRLKPPAAAE